MMTIRADGHREIAFDAKRASLDLEYSRSMVFFTWAGFDEMDDVNGSSTAEREAGRPPCGDRGTGGRHRLTSPPMNQ